MSYLCELHIRLCGELADHMAVNALMAALNIVRKGIKDGNIDASDLTNGGNIMRTLIAYYSRRNPQPAIEVVGITILESSHVGGLPWSPVVVCHRTPSCGVVVRCGRCGDLTS